MDNGNVLGIDHPSFENGNAHRLRLIERALSSANPLTQGAFPAANFPRETSRVDNCSVIGCTIDI